MRAVVDQHSRALIEIRTAAPARLFRRLMDGDSPPRRGKPYAGCEPCQTRADNMHPADVRRTHAVTQSRLNAVC
jgi:hypothetical protein